MPVGDRLDSLAGLPSCSTAPHYPGAVQRNSGTAEEGVTLWCRHEASQRAVLQRADAGRLLAAGPASAIRYVMHRSTAARAGRHHQKYEYEYSVRSLCRPRAQLLRVLVLFRASSSTGCRY